MFLHVCLCIVALYCRFVLLSPGSVPHGCPYGPAVLPCSDDYELLQWLPEALEPVALLLTEPADASLLTAEPGKPWGLAWYVTVIQRNGEGTGRMISYKKTSV